MGVTAAVQTMVRRALSGPTLADRLARVGGRPSGFDYLRLVLALLILALHACAVATSAPQFAAFLVRSQIAHCLVPMFFALSGFLVAGSLDRAKSLAQFLWLRVLRIFPALWVDILFSALVLGPLLTVMPPGQYLRAPLLHSYFLNLVGEVHYYLPGLFTHNHDAKVNSQLWTIPFELCCYLLLSGCALAGIYRRPRLLVPAALASIPAIWLANAAISAWTHKSLPDFEIIVVPCFLAGVAAHACRARIPWSPRLFTLCLAIIAAGLAITPLAVYVLAPAITYVTLFLGLQNPVRLWLVRSGDYSYGIFLYHFPLEQALWLTIPFARTWYGNGLAALPVTFCFALLSWHLVEKHALALRSRLAVSSPPRGL